MTETGKQTDDPQERADESVRIAPSIAIGMCIGIAIGAATDNIGLWLSLGLCFGAAVGVTLHEEKPRREKPRDEKRRHEKLRDNKAPHSDDSSN